MVALVGGALDDDGAWPDDAAEAGRRDRRRRLAGQDLIVQQRVEDGGRLGVEIESVVLRIPLGTVGRV